MGIFSVVRDLAKSAISTASDMISSEIEKKEQQQQALWDELKNELCPDEDVLCYCLISKSAPSDGYAVVIPEYLFVKDKHHSEKFKIEDIECVVCSEEKALIKREKYDIKKTDTMDNCENILSRAENGNDTSSEALRALVSLGSCGIQYAKAVNENRFRMLIVHLIDGTVYSFEGFKRYRLEDFIKQLQSQNIMEAKVEDCNSDADTDCYDCDDNNDADDYDDDYGDGVSDDIDYKE